MPLNPTYSVGTVSVSAGGTVVTGVGTLWLAAGIRAGDVFECRGLTASVASVETNTGLTLARGWSGTAVSASAYELRYTADAPRVIGAAQSVIASFDAVQPVIGLLPSIVTNSGYAAVLQAASAAQGEVQSLGGIVNGRNTRWLRRSGGTCLGGGWVPDGPATPQHWGPAGSGLSDDTAAIKAAIEYGGDVFFPAGVYLIRRVGPDSGGVNAILTTSLRAVADQKAEFTTDDLDNDLISIGVPSNGVGLPAGGIDISWVGGKFNQRNQRVSQVVPNISDFPPPPGKAGVSNTTDGLSIRGSYTVGSQVFVAVNTARVSEVNGDAGDHWSTAGGDSCIFIGGCAQIEVYSCTFRGNRDLAVYTSGVSPSGACRTLIYNNKAVNCFHGFGIKRALSYSRIYDNYVENCVRGYIAEQVDGNKSDYVDVSNNTGRKCNEFVRVTDSIGGSIEKNKFTELGATMANGTTIVPVVGSYGITLRGGSRQRVVDNEVVGVTPGLEAAYPTQRFLLLVSSGDTTTNVVDAVFYRNIGEGMRSVGGGSDGLRVSYIENYVVDATVSPNVTSLGTSGYEVRVDAATKERTFRNRTLFSDGSAALPIIARASGPTSGVYFGTNLVGLSANGSPRVSADANGVGFNGATPISAPLWGAPTGSRLRGSFDASTVTVSELAQRFAALLDDLNNYGLHRR